MPVACPLRPQNIIRNLAQNPARNLKPAARNVMAFAFVLIGMWPVVAMAQEQNQEHSAATQVGADVPDDHFHGRAAGEIVVSAKSLRQLDLLAGVSVLEGQALLRNLDGQIGEMLTRIPGVSATSFAPGASRPVLRGFQGTRVAVLNDGIGATDASGASADHAVALDALTIEHIEVLRGPMALLYGSGAIGGVVNVVDKRIPRRIPDEPVHIDALMGADTAYGLREGGLSLDFPVADGVAAHLDGAWRRTRDMKMAGHMLSRHLRADLLAHAQEEPDEAAALRRLASTYRGRLPDSATRSWSLGGGFTVFSGDSHLGFSAGYQDAAYGVPMRPGAAHHHEGHGDDHADGSVPVSIGLRSFRGDLKGQLAFAGGFFSQLQLRAGYTDYRHVEFEGDEVGTRFAIEGLEARAELVQAERGGWRGSFGVHFGTSDFSAIGAEAFVPAHRTRNFALFAMQEVPLGPLILQAAGRYEHSRVRVAEQGRSRKFDALSGALDLSYQAEDGLKFGVIASRMARAPDGQELFADGPHIATQQYEIGNPILGLERAWGAEAYLRGRVRGTELSLSIYRNWFSDYIALNDIGVEEDGLPVFAISPLKVRFFGVEGEARIPLFQEGDARFLAEIRGDYIRAKQAGGMPLPRIPPLSLSGALVVESPALDGRIEAEWFGKQGRIAQYETRTAGFAFINASLAWRPVATNRPLTLLVKADNIFNATGRRHASFTKDFVPLAGRNFKLVMRLSL